MKRLMRSFAALLCASFATTAAAQYPDKPIRLVVQYGAGGSTDVLARLVGQKLGEAHGWKVIIDNRPGANGVLATDAVAKAAPDGYTLLFNTNSDTANVTLLDNLPYDLERDFAPITVVGAMPHLVVVNPALPVKTVAELIALAKQKPGALNFASVGIGSTPHLAGELFNSMAQVNIVHVPYKGSAQAISDVIGGQVQVMFLGAVSGLPHVNAEKLRMLAVTTSKRLPIIPNVPTVAEAAALPDYDASTWWGLLAPAATPPATVAQIHKAVVRVLEAPPVVEYLAKLGAYPVGSTPADFAAFQKAEIVKWGKILRGSDAKAK
jgi:tripartite-type tricarboxylate transporter receptor subunit TctC